MFQSKLSAIFCTTVQEIGVKRVCYKRGRENCYEGNKTNIISPVVHLIDIFNKKIKDIELQTVC